MKPTDRPKYSTIMRRSRSGVKFKPDQFYTELIKDVERGYAIVARNYGWDKFKNDEVRL